MYWEFLLFGESRDQTNLNFLASQKYYIFDKATRNIVDLMPAL